MVFGACPTSFDKVLIRPVLFGFVSSGFSFSVEVAEFRGAAQRCAATRQKSAVWVVSKAVAFLPYDHFPYGQLARPRARKDAHMPVVLDPKEGGFGRFTVRTGSCLDCPWARGKLPKPTSRVGQRAGRAHLSWPPTLSTVAAGPVTPAGRIGGRDGRLETFSRRKTMVG